ncbi:hypothetical protein [Pseudoxanthomonas mexicana]|uniref:hypothetical protein n=1 Tax=Pseudoxanthomonas mexicana TaxID=128785 RepID=UPI00192ED7F8|nr:hypothetical protein [Pseudoxanthomonas mexicana]
MKHADFAIGTEFEICTGQRWRCTDVGQRSIVAIELRSDVDEDWFHGPPYPVPEVVFDEHDIAGAFRSAEEHILDAITRRNGGTHPGYPHDVMKTMMEAWLREDARTYPRARLLRSDRVDVSGEILHPYAAESTAEGWCILLYAPYTQAFSTLPERVFVSLRAATSLDFEARAKAVREG